MRKLVRVISTTGMLWVGVAAVPLLADVRAVRAAEAPEESSHAKRDLIDEALDDVHLRPEQKSEVQKIQAEAEKRHAPVKAAKSEFLTALARQVEEGKLDRCALGPATKDLASAKAEAHPGDRAAFEKLHSILDPEQRTAFVDALRRHWEEHAKSHEPAALAEKMAKELNLSADQKSSVEKILTGLHEVREAEPRYSAHRDRWTKILDAFKSDRFSLDEVAPMGDVAAHTAAKVDRHLWAAEALLPVLTPEQRKVLADKLRERAKESSARPSIAPGIGPSEEE